jgi:hypothetical protein
VTEHRLGNCLACALLAWARNPFATSILLRRNRYGRWHVLWCTDGRVYEFYAKGRACKNYLQNFAYRGITRLVEFDP